MIASLSELKAFLGITVSTSDDLLTSLLAAADTQIENLCRRKFEQETHIEVLDGQGDDSIFLRNYPIDFPEYGTDSWVKIGRTTKTLLDSSSFDFSEKTGEVNLISGSFPKGIRNVEVKYLGGYSAEDMPADLKQATIELAASLWRSKDNAGKASESVGDYSVSWDGSPVPASVQKIISLYQNVSV